MSLALMRCCATAPLLEAYEAATTSVLSALGVDVVELDFGCCGYPLRNSRFDAYVRSSARNLAVAERAGLDVVTMCSCCFGTLKHVAHLLERDEALRREANAAMEKERLRCSAPTNVRHVLQVLREDVGTARIEEARTAPLTGLRVACHYGCHLLRPSDVVRFDDAKAPTILEELVEATGATPVRWSAQLDCCGSPASGVNDPLSTDLTERKLRSARDAGADVLCVVCPYCHVQLDRVGRALAAERGARELPVVAFHQLLGLCLGLDAESLGVSPGRLRVRAAEPLAMGAAHG